MGTEEEASLLAFLPKTVCGMGSMVTSLGTGARRRDIHVPPAPLPAAEVSSCRPGGRAVLATRSTSPSPQTLGHEAPLRFPPQAA